jgi:hypothetical protein
MQLRSNESRSNPNFVREEIEPRRCAENFVRLAVRMRRRSTLVQAAALVVVGSICAWRWWLAPSRAAERDAAAPELIEAHERAESVLGVALDDRSAELEWRAPGECVEVYRVRIDETFRDASVAAFVGRDEEHSSWLLALGRRGEQPIGVLVREDADEAVRVRELSFGEAQVGPAAPDFACRRRGWDPIEDALALGWPKLPGARVRVGEAWLGAAVEGRCHETVCASEQGKFEHDRRCRARPWRERLAGAGENLAVIVSAWDDAHEPPVGVLTSRTAVIHEGRPLQVSASVEHRWSGVHRDLSLTRLDDCGRMSLAASEDAAAVEQARALARP